MHIYKRVTIVIGLLTLLSGCGSGGSSSNKPSNDTYNITDEERVAPTVYIGEDRKVQVNKTINIYPKVNDPDGVISEYEWTKNGEVLATTLNLTYIPTEIGVDTLTLTVIDDDGISASDSINLTVVEEKIEDTTIDNSNPLPF